MSAAGILCAGQQELALREPGWEELQLPPAGSVTPSAIVNRTTGAGPPPMNLLC